MYLMLNLVKDNSAAVLNALKGENAGMQSNSRFSLAARYGLVLALFVMVTGVACTSKPSAPIIVPAQVTMGASPPQTEFGVAEHRQAFKKWVTDFRMAARAAGIDDDTLSIAFDDVQFLPRVIELDRAQPEFSKAVWDYLDSAMSTQRIARGQESLQQLRPQIDSIAASYGVPAEILVAIWAIESNYGTNVGDIPTIDALATLGFDRRREEWARGQLLAALKILQSRDIDRARMVGSWAGAMGQTQFLPSNFLAYAVDADGDGRRDLWGSVADVMASTANFLARSGWQAGQPWAIEVQLPNGFDYGLADDQVRHSSAVWAQKGVQLMDGAPLPRLPDSSILLASNAHGPAFLVGANYRTILRYNNSASYALAVGLLAQKLAGGPAIQASWPRDLQPLSRSQVIALQTALNARGFDCGSADGMMGPATRRCVRRYQMSLGQPADGYATVEHLQRLQ